jgi:malate/lactate dehydrogenase
MHAFGAESKQTVTGYLPKDDGLQQALSGADIVVIPAGIPRRSRARFAAAGMD